jgi:hypothetical protein
MQKHALVRSDRFNPDTHVRHYQIAGTPLELLNTKFMQ